MVTPTELDLIKTGIKPITEAERASVTRANANPASYLYYCHVCGKPLSKANLLGHQGRDSHQANIRIHKEWIAAKTAALQGLQPATETSLAADSPNALIDMMDLGSNASTSGDETLGDLLASIVDNTDGDLHDNGHGSDGYDSDYDSDYDGDYDSDYDSDYGSDSSSVFSAGDGCDANEDLLYLRGMQHGYKVNERIKDFLSRMRTINDDGASDDDDEDGVQSRANGTAYGIKTDPNSEWYPYETQVELILHVIYNLLGLSESKSKVIHTLLEMTPLKAEMPKYDKVRNLRSAMPHPKVKETTVLSGAKVWHVPISESIGFAACHPAVYNAIKANQHPSSAESPAIHGFMDTDRSRDMMNGFRTSSAEINGRVCFLGDFVVASVVGQDPEKTQLFQLAEFYTHEGRIYVSGNWCDRIRAMGADHITIREDILHDLAGCVPFVPEVPIEIKAVVHADGRSVDVSDAESKAMLAPHPARELARLLGLEIIVVPIGFWADETSGNTSKKYNLFETAAYKIANINGALGRLPHNAQFIAAAKGVSCLEIGEAVVADAVHELANGVVWVNPQGQKVVLVGVVAYLMGDGPKLSLMSSHRHRHRLNCRICLHDKCKGMDDVPLGQLRSQQETWDAIIAYAECEEKIKEVERDPTMNAKVNAKVIKDLKAKCEEAAKGISPGFNPFLALPHLDVHQDTVTDNLHVGPLGHNKYMWEYVPLLGFSLPKNATAIKSFMSSMDTSSYLTVPTGGAIAYHYRSMAGSDLKTSMQFLPFLLDTVLPATRKSKKPEDVAKHAENRDLLLDLAIYTAALNKLLYLSSIEDKNEYLARVDAVSTALYNLIRLSDVLWDEKGRNSFKVHQLLHLADHVRYHGAFVDKSTEVFEATNGPVRAGIIGTNRLNPDRDVARVMAYKAGMEYVGAGGWWLDEHGEARCASEKVRALFQDKAIRKLFGMATDENSARLYGSSRTGGAAAQAILDQHLTVLEQCGLAFASCPEAFKVTEHTRMWTAKRHEGTKIGSNVIFRKQGSDVLLRGKIARLLRVAARGGKAVEFAVLQEHDIRRDLERYMFCPRIELMDRLVLVPTDHVDQMFQVMHACTDLCGAGVHSGMAEYVINAFRITDPEFPELPAPVDAMIVDPTAVEIPFLNRKICD
ncbi:hypothetical protein BC828DRAFT_439527 [Blastocladiella britannica]|nr:hypothetical protein BC828DRAFT_439527 [Blastocladiella britannica]